MNQMSMMTFTLVHISPRCSHQQNEITISMIKNCLLSFLPLTNGISTFEALLTPSLSLWITKTCHTWKTPESYLVNKLVGHCFYRTLTSIRKSHWVCRWPLLMPFFTKILLTPLTTMPSLTLWSSVLSTSPLPDTLNHPCSQIPLSSKQSKLYRTALLYSPT